MPRSSRKPGADKEPPLTLPTVRHALSGEWSGQGKGSPTLSLLAESD